MCSDWKVFRNFRTKTGIQVKCANGALIEKPVGGVDFLTDVLLVPQLKKNLNSEGKLTLSGWRIVTFDRVKKIYDKRWSKIMEAVIQNDGQPLYIVDSAYFPITESAQVSEVVDQVEETALAGMADKKDQGVEEM